MDGEAGRRQQGTAPSGAATVPLGRSPSRPGTAAGGAQSFDSALRELKDLQPQLHQAADCCEKAFLSTEKKKLILEGTKSYICDAVVAVIDHLGNVSSKIEHQLQRKTEITQTEQRINFLKQRLLTCEQYGIFLELLTVRGDTNALKYHRRYLSQSTEWNKKKNGANSSKDAVEPFEVIFPTGPGATRTLKPYDVEPTIGRECTMSVPGAYVGNPAAIRSSFSFRAEDVQIVPGYKKKKAGHGSNILSFLKKSRRHA